MLKVCTESIYRLKVTSKESWVVWEKHKGAAMIAVLLKYVKATPTCTYVSGLLAVA